MKRKLAFIVCLIYLGPVFEEAAASDNYYYLTDKSTRAYYEKKNIGDEKKGFPLEYGMAVRIPDNHPLNNSWRKREWVYLKPTMVNWIEKKRVWLRTKDFTSVKDFKKIEKEWPIRWLYYEFGDAGSWIEFGKDGSAKILNIVDQKTWYGHLFRSKNVILLRYPKPMYNYTWVTAEYDQNTDQLILREDEYRQGKFTDKKQPIIDGTGTCRLDCKSRLKGSE